MKIIPSFKPAISYGELNRAMGKIIWGNSPFRYTDKLEREFARYLNVKYAIRVPSARWGLYYILKSKNLVKGDEVIIPAFTYFAVPAAIIKLGLKPVFVDINARNINIDVQKITESITKKTKAIIPTHLCGFVCELDEIINIAQKYKIKIIEDCAQSLGAEYKGKRAGSFGEAAYFTFGITKNFTTLGGGMIATNNDRLANMIRYNITDISPISSRILFFRLLKAYITKFATSSVLFPVVCCIMTIFSYFDIDIIDIIFRERESLLSNLPYFSQLNSIQAELGLAQLKDLDRNNEIRMQKGLELYKMLKDADNIQIVSLDEKAKNIFSNFPILIKNKKDVRRILLHKGIDVSAGYMQDCSRLDVFKEFKKDCPNASRVESEILYLPLYAELSYSNLKYVADVLKKL